MLPCKVRVNKLVIQEGMTLTYHWTCSSASVIQSILMRDVGSSYWHLSPSIGREETVKVPCTERLIIGPPAAPTVPPVSSRLPADTQFDGLDLYYSITFQPSIISPCARTEAWLQVGARAFVCRSRVVGWRCVWMWRGRREDESWCPSWSRGSGQTYFSTWKWRAREPEIEYRASRLLVQSLPKFLRGFVRCLFISHLPQWVCNSHKASPFILK